MRHRRTRSRGGGQEGGGGEDLKSHSLIMHTSACRSFQITSRLGPVHDLTVLMTFFSISFSAALVLFLTTMKYNSETLTCPGGSLRNSDEVAPDLARSEMNVCETNLVITTVGHSVKGKEQRLSDMHHNRRNK